MQICPQDLQQQVEALNTELTQLKTRETQESTSDLSAKLQELHAQYVSLLSCAFLIVSQFQIEKSNGILWIVQP